MRKPHITLVWLVWIMCVMAGSAPARVANHDPDVYGRGRRLTQQLLSGKLEYIAQRMSSELRTAVGGRAGLARLMQQVEQEAGQELGVMQEAAYHERGRIDYGLDQGTGHLVSRRP